MIRDFRINTLFKNIVNKLLNNKNSNYKVWLEKYEKLPNNLKEDLVVSIYKFQVKNIKLNCERKEESYLPFLGTFKIKETRNIALTIKSGLIKEKGYSSWQDVPEIEKELILKEIDEIKKKKLIDINSKRRLIKEGNTTKVLYLSNFKCKKKE
jgi:hypothetical protein